MKHSEAVELSAAERYLLDELSPELRHQFEEHFFDCHECSEELCSTANFLDMARKELKAHPFPELVRTHEPVPNAPVRRAEVVTSHRKSTRLFLWTPAFLVPALAALLLVVAYQNIVVLPRVNSQVAELRGAEVLPTVSLVGSNSRGGDSRSVSTRPDQPFLVSVDIPAEDRYTGYTCEVLSPAGAVAWRVDISPQQAKDTVAIRLPGVRDPEGHYSLVVRGNTTGSRTAAGQEIARYHLFLHRAK